MKESQNIEWGADAGNMVNVGGAMGKRIALDEVEK